MQLDYILCVARQQAPNMANYKNLVYSDTTRKTSTKFRATSQQERNQQRQQDKLIDQWLRETRPHLKNHPKLLRVGKQ